jgi:hypothetical protein
MKILIVLALLFSLCTAYQDFSFDSIANTTQAYGANQDFTSLANCVFTQTYTDADKTLKGTFTCTSLQGNVTMAHLHDVGKSSSVTYTGGAAIVADCPISINADQMSGLFSCVFLTTSTTMDSICNDQCYWNVHTTFDPTGEVRANLVNMAPICNIKGGVALDGVAVAFGADPTTGVLVKAFSVGFFFTAVSPAVGGGYVYATWNPTTSEIIFSGIFYGLASDVSTIYAYYPPQSTTSYYLYISYYSFPTGCPFSFKTTSIDDWDIAKFASGLSYITVVTADGSELTLTIKSDDFPKSSAVCRPYTASLPLTPLKCKSGYEDILVSETTCYDNTYFCGIEDFAGEYKGCSYYSSCYDCDCGADVATDLPSSGYACCDIDYCNSVSLAVLNCIGGGSGAASISVGFLVSLFVALFMKWFN